tara:strand:- start:5677 stop:6198 length:522 start_codon:yes stop_codon:yes gene_type:complete
MLAVWRSVQAYRNLDKKTCKGIVHDRFEAQISDPINTSLLEYEYNDPGIIHRWVELDGVQTIEFDVKRLANQLDSNDADTLLRDCYTRMYTGTGGAVNLVFDLQHLSWNRLTVLRKKCTHDEQLAGAALYVAMKQKVNSVKVRFPSDAVACFFVSALVAVCVPSKIRNRMTRF